MTKDLEKEDIKIITPKMGQVIMFNDDITTFDFVIEILMNIFQKSKNEAIVLSLKIDNKGSSVIGTYPLDIALTKANQTTSIARMNGFPLKTIVEKV
jgi:ATP-dependent Clp protease adaptor protein ClpS